MTSDWQRASRSLVLLISICALLPSASNAQWPQQQQRRRPGDLNKYKNLTQPVPIPELPPYSGPNKLLFGSEVTGRGAGVNYVERFVIKDQPNQVHEWYRQTLTNYGWKVTLNTKSSIYANKSGNYLSISFNGTYHEGWGSEIVVHYSPKE